MFSFNHKLDVNLKTAMKNKDYKMYRILISCKNLHENIERKITSYRGVVIRSIPSINCICATLSSNAIEKLSEFPQVDFITFDSYCFLCDSSTRAKTNIPIEANINSISDINRRVIDRSGLSVHAANGIFTQERYKLTGKGIGIGIIDSGTYPHPDLSMPTNKIKGFLDLIQGLKYPYDDNGHGTFISGLVSGNGQCSKGLYKGIAENSHLYIIKAFNQLGRGYVSDILFGISELINSSDKHNLKIVCLPFELVEHNFLILPLFSKLFAIAVQKGMVIVVPSGHNGNIEGSIKGIATLDNCITVAGLDTTHIPAKLYPYSSGGLYRKLEKPDLSSACVNLCSLNCNKDYISERGGRKLYAEPLGNPYTCYSGTSCATAFIAGICALLYENKPDLNHRDMLALLKVSCKLLEIPKWLQGAGMIEMNKLLP